MIKNVITFLLALILALGIAEIGLRVAGFGRVKFEKKSEIRAEWIQVPEHSWVEHHPVLGWYSQKNRTASLKSPQFPEVAVHTNSSGFRGTREYSILKPQGIKRVALLGDSFAFGFGVQDRETFAVSLEEADRKLEVLNVGVPGYGMDQIYLSYREVAKKYNPDIVLIGIFPEDFWRCTRSFADSGHVKPYFSLASNDKLVLHNVPVPPPYSLNTNQFPLLIEQGFVRKILYSSLLYRLLQKPFTKLAKNLRLIDPESSDEWIIGRAILHEMLKDIRRDGAKPVLLLMPSKDWAQTTRRTSLERSLIRFAKREKIDMIDLKPAFYAAVSDGRLEDYYIKDDWHWTAKGHALTSHEIQQYLKQNEH